MYGSQLSLVTSVLGHKMGVTSVLVTSVLVISVRVTSVWVTTVLEPITILGHARDIDTITIYRAPLA